MKDNYLIHGTNALKGSLRYVKGERFRYEPKSVGVYLSSACKTLSYLMEDSETLDTLAKGMSGHSSVKYNQFEDFVEEFVKPDHHLLIAAGMDEKMVAYLFGDMNKLQDRMNRKAEISSDLLRERIKELAYSVCAEDTSFKEGNRLLWRAIRVIGGGAIITTNYVSDAIIGGLASAFSQTFGGMIITHGFEG